MAEDSDRSIKLYHYPFSPYAKKVLWYLTLRQLPYAEVKQPPYLPRPDRDAIGIAYRRIPFMTIGKDVYCDTRLILRKLEELFPEGKIGATTLEGQALQKLLETWHVEAMFVKATQTMPSDMPILNDSKFAKDREQFSGRSWNRETIDKNRPEALAYVRGVYSFLENTLLADGRNWVLKTEQPTLADIEAIWIVHWLLTLKGALPEEMVSKSSFPKVFAYIDRFDQAVKSAKSSGPRPTSLKGKAAAEQILASNFAESEGDIEHGEPQKLRKGDQVEVFPTDSGFSHHDKGVLLSLNSQEIVIGLENGLRLHTPRTGFRVQQVSSKL